MKLLNGGLIESPILNRELRTLLRSPRSFFWMLLFLSLLLLVFGLRWERLNFQDRDLAARALFKSIGISQAVIFCFLAPILTSGAISGEHERRTFSLLATTPLSGYHVALAKCFSALCYILLLSVASLPVLAITLLMGGVGWYEIVAAGLATLMTVLVAGMVGVACSAWTRRTYIALMVSFAVVIAEVFFVGAVTGMVAGIAGAINSATRGISGGAAFKVLGLAGVYMAIQFVVFLGLTHLARNGYLAGTRTPPQRSKKMVKSRVVLQERKRRYPYYLIDPLKEPQPVPDGANAIYVRDKRHQPLGRLEFIIRISYVCLFASIFMGLVMLSAEAFNTNIADEMFASMIGASNIAVIVILLAAPLFACTAFSSEKEHGTFAAMMTTLIPPHQVVWAKLRIILRYTLFLLAALFIPALVEVFCASFLSGYSRHTFTSFLILLLWFTPYYVLLILGSALFGLMVSARSRSMIRSMVVTYLGMIICCALPWVIEFFFKRYWIEARVYRRPSTGWIHLFDPAFALIFRLVDLVAPVISPFCFLMEGRRAGLSAHDLYENPILLVLYTGLFGTVLALLYAGTLRALNRSLRFDTPSRKSS